MRLRSANRGNANNAWNVNTTGNANNNNATNANRPAPDCEMHGRIKPRPKAVSVRLRRKEPRSLLRFGGANNTTMMPATDTAEPQPDGLRTWETIR